MKKNIPNIITAVRIIGAAVLLFVEPLVVPFYVIYTLCGLSDAIDGFVARLIGAESALGVKLDSVADLMFYAVMFLKVFPVMLTVLELYVWCVGLCALLIRVVIYILAAIRFHKFSSMHTVLNKISGFAVFLIPYFLSTSFGMYYCLLAATIANISAIHELVLHLTGKTYVKAQVASN